MWLLSVFRACFTEMGCKRIDTPTSRKFERSGNLWVPWCQFVTGFDHDPVLDCASCKLAVKFTPSYRSAQT